NCSPSFNWSKSDLGPEGIASFQKDLGKLGYKWIFITLAGFHIDALVADEMAHTAEEYGPLAAVSELRERELRARAPQVDDYVRLLKSGGITVWNQLVIKIKNPEYSLDAGAMKTLQGMNFVGKDGQLDPIVRTLVARIIQSDSDQSTLIGAGNIPYSWVMSWKKPLRSIRSLINWGILWTKELSHLAAAKILNLPVLDFRVGKTEGRVRVDVRNAPRWKQILFSASDPLSQIGVSVGLVALGANLIARSNGIDLSTLASVGTFALAYCFGVSATVGSSHDWREVWGRMTGKKLLSFLVGHAGSEDSHADLRKTIQQSYPLGSDSILYEVEEVGEPVPVPGVKEVKLSAEMEESVAKHLVQHIADLTIAHALAAFNAWRYAAKNSKVGKFGDKVATIELNDAYNLLPYVLEVQTAEGARDEADTVEGSYGLALLARNVPAKLRMANDPVEVTERLQRENYMANISIGAYAMLDVYRDLGMTPPSLILPDLVYMFGVVGPKGSGVTMDMPAENFVRDNMVRVARARKKQPHQVRVTGVLLRERHMSILNSAFSVLGMKANVLASFPEEIRILFSERTEDGVLYFPNKKNVTAFKDFIKKKNGGQVTFKNSDGGSIRMVTDGDLMPVMDIVRNRADISFGAGGTAESMSKSRMGYQGIDFQGVIISNAATKDGNPDALQVTDPNARYITVQKEIDAVKSAGLAFERGRAPGSNATAIRVPTIFTKDALTGGPANLTVVASVLGNKEGSLEDVGRNDYVTELEEIKILDQGRRVHISLMVVEPSGKTYVVTITFKTRLGEYLDGLSQTKDQHESVSLHLKAGRLYGDLKMYEEADRHFKWAAEKAYMLGTEASASHKLASGLALYYKGMKEVLDSQEPNLDTAQKSFQRAAENGYSKGLMMLEVLDPKIGQPVETAESYVTLSKLLGKVLKSQGEERQNHVNRLLIWIANGAASETDWDDLRVLLIRLAGLPDEVLSDAEAGAIIQKILAASLKNPKFGLVSHSLLRRFADTKFDSPPFVAMVVHVFNERSTRLANLGLTARAIAPFEGGVLAADESEGTAGKRLTSVGLENTPENRQNMRRMMLTAPGLKSAGVTGVILYKETLDNTDAGGNNLVQKHLIDQGILPGLKTDSGLVDDPETGEKVPNPNSLTNLPDLITKAQSAGAVFTKWRTTTRAQNPSEAIMRRNAKMQAWQAKYTQDSGLVPMVEPEVVFDGSDGTPADHDLEASYVSTTRMLEIVFEELGKAGVLLGGMVLKTSMILAGKKSPHQTDSERVGFVTLIGLLKTVPAEVPTIVFLSGGQADNQATENMDAVIRASQTRFEEARDAAVKELRAEGKTERADVVKKLKRAPWQISYSFGRGLQARALRAWGGKDENFAKGQAEMLATVREVSWARRGNLQSYRQQLEKQGRRGRSIRARRIVKEGAEGDAEGTANREGGTEDGDSGAGSWFKYAGWKLHVAPWAEIAIAVLVGDYFGAGWIAGLIAGAVYLAPHRFIPESLGGNPSALRSWQVWVLTAVTVSLGAQVDASGLVQALLSGSVLAWLGSSSSWLTLIVLAGVVIAHFEINKLDVEAQVQQMVQSSESLVTDLQNLRKEKGAALAAGLERVRTSVNSESLKVDSIKSVPESRRAVGRILAIQAALKESDPAKAHSILNNFFKTDSAANLLPETKPLTTAFEDEWRLLPTESRFAKTADLVSPLLSERMRKRAEELRSEFVAGYAEGLGVVAYATQPESDRLGESHELDLTKTDTLIIDVSNADSPVVLAWLVRAARHISQGGWGEENQGVLLTSNDEQAIDAMLSKRETVLEASNDKETWTAFKTAMQNQKVRRLVDDSHNGLISKDYIGSWLSVWGWSPAGLLLTDDNDRIIDSFTAEIEVEWLESNIKARRAGSLKNFTDKLKWNKIILINIG
ncbi:MAG: fructose-bisphosphate aldolase, partial [Elusimicrobia bacterium]|nr:fructose-bisphosphate aldolase [Elusimicrobiota bacterium]